VAYYAFIRIAREESYKYLFFHYIVHEPDYQKPDLTENTERPKAEQTQKNNMFFSFSRINKPVVLLVDDNIFIKKLLTKILQAKYTIYTAADGLEALILLHQKVKPDLIITDIEMPGMNGYEMLRNIAKSRLYRHIPVCILSDTHANSIRNELGNIQVENIFAKPFEPRTLLANLDTLFARIREHDQLSNFTK
jgi:two-component system chemotaxis response regulator CheY